MAPDTTRNWRLLLGLLAGLGLMAVGVYVGIPPDDPLAASHPVVSQAGSDELSGGSR